jgi:hypothetical protein
MPTVGKNMEMRLQRKEKERVMARKMVTFRIKGVSPTMIHSNQTADPLNPWAIEKARVSAKKKKTPEDHFRIAEVEFFSSFYDSKKPPFWPGVNVKKMLVEAAKSQKRGKDVQKALSVPGECRIEYAEPKKDATAEDLWRPYATVEKFTQNPFAKRMLVKNQTSTVVRTRPIFNDWGLTINVSYDTEVFRSDDEIRELLVYAGQYIGLSDARNIDFGRFEIA